MSKPLKPWTMKFDEEDINGVWARRPLIIPAGPNILVVGPDGVGKTTIVEELSDRLGIPSFKFPSEQEVFKKGQRGQLLFDLGLAHFLKQTGLRFISDRGYPCEWVYSAVFGRESDVATLEAIDQTHASIGTKILYLYSSVLPEEKDELVPDEFYFRVKDGYDQFAKWTKCRVYPYDTAGSLHLDGDERRHYEFLATAKLLNMISEENT
jgi:hypothetical protein